MAILLSLLFGLGLWLMYQSTWYEVPMDEYTVGLKRLRSWTRARLGGAGFSDTKTRNFWFLVVGCVLAGWVVATVANMPAVYTILLPTFAAFVPFMYLFQRREKVMRMRENAWPDAIDHLLSAIRSGMNLPESLCQLSEHGPTALRPYFADFTRNYRSGTPFHQCLQELQERLQDPIADRLASTLTLSAHAGGHNLGKCLAMLSAFLRKESHLRGELRARQSWTTNSAKLAVTAPWIVLLLMYRQPGYSEAFHSPTGNLIVLIGVLACLGSYLLMRRLGVLPRVRRVMS